MNALKKQITDMILKEVKTIKNNTEGEIISFDNEKMLADVKIRHPNGSGSYRLNHVPMQLGSGGMSQSGPYLGDKVMINFKNGNIHTPVIVSILDVNHKNNFRDVREKHMRKGSMCPDNICVRNDWSYNDELYQDVIGSSGYFYD